jgi:hypothetical protein
MSAYPLVLCLQDTTGLDFNGQEAAGLGPLSYEARRGMYMHPTCAVTPEREPLGVLDAWMWAREERGKDGVRRGQKESTRWIEGYARVAEMAADMPDTRLVYVINREADLLAMMARNCGHIRPPAWRWEKLPLRCRPGSNRSRASFVSPSNSAAFLGRKSDGEPGIKTIWQGLQRVMDVATA